MPLFFHTWRALRTLRHDPHFRALAFLAFVALTTGTVFYWLVEDWRLIDCLYFSAATLTTVGYGDFTPQTDAGKLFTVVYVLVGVGVMLAFIARVAGQAVQSRVEGHRPREDDEPRELDEPRRRRAA
jgi:voltage-gated potassium channel